MSVTQVEQPALAAYWNLSIKPQPNNRNFPPDASIVLVGSRGAGKRSLGFIGATHLGCRLITEDHYFQEKTGTSRGEFLRKWGSQAFYRKNVELLRRVLDENRFGCIIECGMGSLSSPAQRILFEYTKTNPVIYITRNSNRIRSLLRLGHEEAARLESADLAHRHCSNFEYYNLHDPSCDGSETPPENGPVTSFSRLKNAKEDFCNYLDILTGKGVIRSGFESPFSIAALPPECRARTFALSLRLSTVSDLDLVELEAGADAVQLKIDTWSHDLHNAISKQVAVIRRSLGVPILFQIEEYAFEDSQLSLGEKENAYFELIEYSLRLGVEYVVLNLKYPSDRLSHLIRSSGRTKVIGNYLAREDEKWSWDEESRLIDYRRAQALGCDMVRFIRASSKASDNDAVRAFVHKIESSPNHLPVIAYNVGLQGRPSLIANRIFTPVTHPIMNTTVSKSQIRQFLPTAAEATQALYHLRILDPLHFYILGASVFYSLSPAMHNAAYQMCGISNDFQSLQVASLEELQRVCQDPNFGGAAITHPYKVVILSRIAAKSHHAKAVGAINTLVPLRMLSDNSAMDGSTQSLLRHANERCKAGPIIAYYGDNTDFIGIMTCLRRNLSPRNAIQPSKTTGLVIGAGGMARAAVYAMIQLGCRKVFMYNRTIERAESVARHFNSWASGLSSDGEIVRVLKSGDEAWPEGYRQPTMIVSCVPARSVGNEPPPNFKMPIQWLGSPTGGVIVELAYLPLDTPLLRQIRRVREETKQAWVIVNGLEVLPEQAIAQFELMTGRRAPRRRMRLEVLKNYHLYEELGLENP